MSENLWIALDPRVGSSTVMRPLRTWGAARRSVLDRSGHHAVPTCRRGDLSALGHVGFPTEDDVAEAVCSGLRCVLYDAYRQGKRMDQSSKRLGAS